MKLNIRPYSDIQSEYQDKIIPYTELLQATEWRDKRELIIYRDGKKCTQCKRKATRLLRGNGYRPITEEERKKHIEQAEKEMNELEKEMGFRMKIAVPIEIQIPKEEIILLHVHHQYYILEKLPWQYQDGSLTTLCQHCHQSLHDKEVIPVYLDVKGGELVKVTPCTKCNGSGYIDEYYYYMQGVCFRCDGLKYNELIKKPTNEL